MKYLLVALMCLSALAFADNPFAMGCVSGTYTRSFSNPVVQTMGASVTSPQVWLGKAYGGLALGWQDSLSTNTFYAGYQFISPEAFSPYVCLESGLTSYDPDQDSLEYDNDCYFAQSLGFLNFVSDFSIDGSLTHSQTFVKDSTDSHMWSLSTEIGYSWWIPQISSSIALTCYFDHDMGDQVLSVSPMTFSF